MCNNDDIGSLPDDEILDRFANLRRWQDTAPHKPLTLLWMLSRIQRGHPRLTPFELFRDIMTGLLEDFCDSGRPEVQYPWWHLQNEAGLWEIENLDELESRVADRVRSRPSMTDLQETQSRAGFPSGLEQRLRSSPILLRHAARALLENNFPRSLRDDIVDAIGLELAPVEPSGELQPEQEGDLLRRRAFRQSILDAYERACAVCGFAATLGASPVGLVAAHVRWPSAGGPDALENGILLCGMHYRAFDRGAATVDEDGIVQLAETFTGPGVESAFGPWAGRPLRSEVLPGVEHRRWHVVNVFSG